MLEKDNSEENDQKMKEKVISMQHHLEVLDKMEEKHKAVLALISHSCHVKIVIKLCSSCVHIPAFLVSTLKVLMTRSYGKNALR